MENLINYIICIWQQIIPIESTLVSYFSEFLTAQINTHFYSYGLCFLIGMLISAGILFLFLQIKQKRINSLTKIENELQETISTKDKAITQFKQKLANTSQLNKTIETSIDKYKLIEKQAEELEKTYEQFKTLSKFGQNITAKLSVEKILDAVYKKVNLLADAPIFCIGIYNKEANSLDIYGIANDVSLEIKRLRISDTSHPAIHCFKNKEELFFNSIETFEKKFQDKSNICSNETFEAIICLPLTIKGHVTGIMCAMSNISNSYTTTHLDIFRNISVYTTIALENAKTYQHITEQADELEKIHSDFQMLSKFGRNITTKLSVPKILDTVYKKLNLLVDAPFFQIAICDTLGQTIELYGIDNDINIGVKYLDPTIENHPIVNCLNTKKELLFTSKKQIQNYSENSENSEEAKNNYISEIYIPFKTKHKITGLICAKSINENAYNAKDFNILHSIATYTAIAIDNAQAYKQIEKQKAEIEHTHRQITKSIDYASTIQNAVMPRREDITACFPNHFILWKPRDTVSGDYYWFRNMNRNNKNYYVLVAADCTGHGVPGAFLSMLGISFLNEIIQNNKVWSSDNKASTILDLLRTMVKTSLKQSGGIDEAKDGMDLSLCIIDSATLEMEFAGAFNSVYIIRKNSLPILADMNNRRNIMGKEYNLSQIEATAQPIGVYFKEFPFENRKIQLHKGDMLYQFSDGYADQFGGPKGKTFKSGKLKKLLMDIHKNTMPKQHDILLKTIEDWIGNTQKQVDDITIIGIRI